jgi:hypothetical protein
MYKLLLLVLAVSLLAFVQSVPVREEEDNVDNVPVVDQHENDGIVVSNQTESSQNETTTAKPEVVEPEVVEPEVETRWSIERKVRENEEVVNVESNNQTSISNETEIVATTQNDGSFNVTVLPEEEHPSNLTNVIV